MPTTYTKRTPTEKELSDIKELVQRQLRGDEEIIAAYLIDENNAESRWSIAWQSEARRLECLGRDMDALDSGTHVALLSKVDNQRLIIWGHYDMKSGAAVTDAFTRSERSN